MILNTGTLTPAQIVHEVTAIAEIFRANAIRNVIAFFGWGTLDDDKLWSTTNVSTEDLVALVERSIDQKTVIPGASDLFLRDEHKTIEFQLCHHAAIHLTTDIQTLFEQVENRWSTNGFLAE
jgi:hypothetical protein